MVDNDDFDRACRRLQLVPKPPLHSLENYGAFRRRAFVEVQIEVIESSQSSFVDDGVTDVALEGGCQRLDCLIEMWCALI
jgi:hypothetical protein